MKSSRIYIVNGYSWEIHDGERKWTACWCETMAEAEERKAAFEADHARFDGWLEQEVLDQEEDSGTTQSIIMSEVGTLYRMSMLDRRYVWNWNVQYAIEELSNDPSEFSSAMPSQCRVTCPHRAQCCALDGHEPTEWKRGHNIIDCPCDGPLKYNP